MARWEPVDVKREVDAGSASVDSLARSLGWSRGTVERARWTGELVWPNFWASFSEQERVSVMRLSEAVWAAGYGSFLGTRYVRTNGGLRCLAELLGADVEELPALDLSRPDLVQRLRRFFDPWAPPADVGALRSEGLTMFEIARRTGLSVSGISRALSRNVRLSKPSVWSFLSEAERGKLFTLFESLIERWGYSALSRSVGMGASNLSFHRKQKRLPNSVLVGMAKVLEVEPRKLVDFPLENVPAPLPVATTDPRRLTDGQQDAIRRVLNDPRCHLSALARAMDTQQTSLCNIRHGFRPCGRAVAERIAVALGIPVSQVLSGDVRSVVFPQGKRLRLNGRAGTLPLLLRLDDRTHTLLRALVTESERGSLASGGTEMLDASGLVARLIHHAASERGISLDDRGRVTFQEGKRDA